jgi:hypothetical protein
MRSASAEELANGFSQQTSIRVDGNQCRIDATGERIQIVRDLCGQTELFPEPLGILTVEIAER